jgi:DnaJ-like protein
MDEISESYRILEVHTDASLEEVKRAYRELARVWHPDRFGNDVRLQQKAQEKLKQINLAYEQICGRGTHEPRRPTTSTTGPIPQPRQTTPPPPQWTPPRPSAQTAQSVPRKPQTKSWFWGPAGPPRRGYAWLVYLSVTLAGLLMIVLPRIPSPPPPAQLRQSGSQQPTDIFDRLTQSHSASSKPPQDVSSSPPWLAFQSSNSAIVSPTPIEIRRAEPVSELGQQSRYFTIGSTKNDVLRIQGSPDRFTDTTFSYGSSNIRFEGDRVVSWSNYYPRLKAQLLPRAGIKASPFFTIGSSKDEVLAVQGSPDRFTDRMFAYGSSSVQFEGDRVVSWSNYYPRLKAQLLPRPGTNTPR